MTRYKIVGLDGLEFDEHNRWIVDGYETKTADLIGWLHLVNRVYVAAPTAADVLEAAGAEARTVIARYALHLADAIVATGHAGEIVEHLERSSEVEA